MSTATATLPSPGESVLERLYSSMIGYDIRGGERRGLLKNKNNIFISANNFVGPGGGGGNYPDSARNPLVGRQQEEALYFCLRLVPSQTLRSFQQLSR